ncbi:hypothetical protein ABC383_22760 [Noviherbaspirillum sp. 1P10PC]|uniref:hypothetical protein n=1 Tax=Noviherbaspirillum sp. 1P10PC TaxID=3132292 RepID=UPI00399F15F4
MLLASWRRCHINRIHGCIARESSRADPPAQNIVWLLEKYQSGRMDVHGMRAKRHFLRYQETGLRVRWKRCSGSGAMKPYFFVVHSTAFYVMYIKTGLSAIPCATAIGFASEARQGKRLPGAKSQPYMDKRKKLTVTTAPGPPPQPSLQAVRGALNAMLHSPFPFAVPIAAPDWLYNNVSNIADKC